ncbi:hypothetical protein [Actinacidiphila acidipaludis]|uniref:Gram-positive cocci surface proteins LPxTG domain-containing protein n=1 Tax=Actinacidiphila acidipaludis TaxID=2873382 RepID=A0ABS7QAN4_9ACTN|nr:hypothetical protein [Streptomyces acidipaludis]MBY8880193.1 hypothetical protein [Streptomyces acidipaludis]
MGLVALGTAGGAWADGAGQVTIRVMADPQTYFVPSDGDTGHTPAFGVALASGSTDSTGDELDIKGATAAFDLSALKGVDVSLASGAGSCALKDLVVTCPLGDFYQRTELAPVTLTARAGTPVGDAGALTMTVTAGNAATVTRSTQVIVGRPGFSVLPGASGPLTGGSAGVAPAFGNRGDVAVAQGMTVWVHGSAPTTREFSNCRYNKADQPTAAECDFTVTLRPGQAFTTDGQFTFTAPSGATGLTVGYDVWPTGNPPEWATELPADAPHGTAGPLALKPTDESALTAGTDYTAQYTAPGGDKTDYAATPFTIRGAVGQTLDVQVPYPTDNRDNGPVTVKDPQIVTLPEGTHALVPGPDEESEALYCAPTSGRTVTCPFGPDGFGQILRVHIDRKVPGASGTIEVVPPAGVDDNPADNTAVVTLVVTGTGTGTSGGTTAGGSSGSATASGGTSSSGGSSGGSSSGGASGTSGTSGSTGGTPEHGGLAATGTAGIALITSGAVIALVAGSTLVMRRRRSA